MVTKAASKSLCAAVSLIRNIFTVLLYFFKKTKNKSKLPGRPLTSCRISVTLGLQFSMRTVAALCGVKRLIQCLATLSTSVKDRFHVKSLSRSHKYIWQMVTILMNFCVIKASGLLVLTGSETPLPENGENQRLL